MQVKRACGRVNPATLAICVVLAGCCGTQHVASSCTEGATPHFAGDPAKFRAYRLCAPDGRWAGVAVTVVESKPADRRLRTERDVVAFSSTLLQRSLGRKMAEGIIALRSAGRSSRLSFYEAGVLGVHSEEDQDGQSFVRAFEFWAYRPIRGVPRECTSVLVGDGDRPVHMIVTEEGAFYTDSRVDCRTLHLRAIHAAGPVDKAVQTPLTPP